MYSAYLNLVIWAAIFLDTSRAQFGFGSWGNFPSCASSCMNDWDSGSFWTNGGESFCTNATLVASVNSCVDSSSCSGSDKESIYKNFAQLCANAGHSVTAAPEATFAITANPTWTTSALSGSDGPWGTGVGPFGGGWGPWGTTGSWTSGAWTNWWNGAGCPGSTWSGWTSGDWDSKAPWTSWTACSAATTATVTFTTTATNGGVTSVITATTFGVKVVEGTASSTAKTSATGTGGSSGASSAIRSHDSMSLTLFFGSLVAATLGALAVL